MRTFSVGFYNTENFFDFNDDAFNHDKDFTPGGSKKWTENRYRNKVKKIGQAISLPGLKETGSPPLFAGLAEVENAKVLNDLVHCEHLIRFGYEYIHFDSPDERGMDTAVIFRKNLINPEFAEPIRFRFPGTDMANDFTRDVLYVRFKLQDFLIHTFVMHLPSRRDMDVNRNFRNHILKTIRNRVDEILEDPNAYVILMGDMNGNPDDPDAVSILKTREVHAMNPSELFNPMLRLRKSTGSLIHEGNWILYDQMIFSHSFFQPGGLSWVDTQVFRNRMLQSGSRKFSGLPFRTFAGNKYLGGYSDHFPVYAILNY